MLILDFDGVLSPIVLSGMAYRRALIQNLSQKTGLPVDYVVKEFNHARSEVMKRPWEYGWLVDGHRVTLGDEDPYVLYSSAAEEMYNRNPKYRFCSFEEYYEFLDDVFHDSAARACSKIDRDTKKTVEALAKRTDLYIVSNGRRERICDALDKVGLSLNVNERTNKMIVDPAFEKTERYLHVDSLKKIELRRPHYYEALKKLKGDGRFSDMTVVGDVLSLDLALPYHLGMNIVLKENPYTPGWSKEFVAQNGRVVSNLNQLLEFI